MARLEDGTVMLRATKHLEAHGDRPFAAAQGDKGGTPVMLRATKHLEAHGDRPFAALRVTKEGPLSC